MAGIRTARRLTVSRSPAIVDGLLLITQHTMEALDTTALRFVDLQEAGPVRDALHARADILRMTQQAEEAVLRPRDPGGWSHDLRAALAARIAEQHELADLVLYYKQRVSDGALLPICSPDYDGSDHGLTDVLGFMDRVSREPREVVAADVDQLTGRGVSDADVVRLTELNAFMAYQLRLIAGLTLLGGAAS